MHLRSTSILVALALFGCASEDPGTGIDASVDATQDATQDTRKDAPLDAPKDAPVDAPVDAPIADAGADASDASDASDGSDDASDASDAGSSCNAAVTGSCGFGMYCDAVGCGFGTCKQAVPEIDTLDPVCGCDSITYWNKTTAQNRGATAATKGECTVGKVCGGFGGFKCPGNTRCNYRMANASDCNASDPSGVCWGIPTSCPITVSPKTRLCGSQKCIDTCNLMASQLLYYDDNSCP